MFYKFMKKKKEMMKTRANQIIWSMLVLLLLSALSCPQQLFASDVSTTLQQETKKVTLSVKEKNLGFILSEIKKQTGLAYGFEDNQYANQEDKFSINVKDVSVETALNILLEKSVYTYQISGNFILIKLRSVSTKKSDQIEEVKITGFVKDHNGEPLPGVTIVLQGTTLGVATDVNGKYTFTAPKQEGMVLIFSFVGMKPIAVKYTGQTTLDVVLTMDEQEMDEVVVTGIFTRKAESYSGSAITYKAADLKRVGNSNLFQSLKNLDPSLMVMENLVNGSNPNAMPSMQLRGASTFPADANTVKSRFQNDPNTPLFILDGFEATQEKIFDMDMNRIESVTILKDATAKAIYGSKAANGVIVIETKKLIGNEPLVSYIGSVDLEMPDLTSYDLCNALEKLEVERREGYYEALGTFIDDKIDYLQLYNERLKRAKEGLDTYWLSKPLHVGVGHKHTLMAELGENALKTNATFTYNEVSGVMKGSDRVVINGDLSLSYRHNKVLFRNIMSVGSMNSNDSPYGSFSTYAQLNPYVSPYDAEGNLLQYLDDFSTGAMKIGNPLYDAQLNTKLSDHYLDFTNNFYVEVMPTEALKLTARMKVASKKTESEQFYPSGHSKFMNLENSGQEDDKLRKGSYNISNGKSWGVSGDFSVQYNKNFAGVHDLFATAQWTLSETKYSETTHYAEGFPNDRMNSITYARQYALDATPTGYAALQRSMGYLLVGGYAYDNRFLFDLNLRGNASSVFGTDKRWGTFWSAGVAWNIHNEAFLANSNFRQLKLRASMGTTGNENFSTNLSMAVYKYYADKYYQDFAGAYLSNMANPSLGWERKLDYSVGLDAQIGGLLVKLDAYIADTKDMAFNRSIVTSTGFATVRDNLGEVRNKGFEASATYTVWRNESGFLNAYAKIATNDNRIRKISDELRSYNESIKKTAEENGSTAPVAIYQDGTPVNAIWAVKSLGIDPNTGKEVFLDLEGNKTYTWSSAHLVNCGSSDPKYNGNFGFNGEYRGIGLSAVFTFHGGGKLYNNTLIDRVENCYIGQNVDRRVFAERWYYSGQEAQYINGYKNGGTQSTSRFVQKNNVLSISSLNAYYEMPKRFVSRIGLQRLRFDVYMNDVATFSSIKVERGTSYPFARTLSFSLTGTF